MGKKGEITIQLFALEFVVFSTVTDIAGVVVMAWIILEFEILRQATSLINWKLFLDRL